MEHPAYSQLRPVTPSVGVVLCPNPGYSSLEGTNSWVVRAPGDESCIVIDPGPDDEGHLNVLNSKAGHIGVVLLTHRHHDHADSEDRFRQLSGAPIRAYDRTYCRGEEPLQDGEIISVPGCTPQVEAVHTPGHTADSMCYFIWSGEPHKSTLEGVATGDTIAGRHTTMISETTGDLGQYLKTLEMLAARGEGVALLPGHGPDAPDLAPFARNYLERRRKRLQQVRDAVEHLGKDAPIKDIVNQIYTNVDPVLRDAAAQSTRVTLRYLESHGEV